MSIPGFGPVYSSGILAELGSVHAFSNNDAIAKYAGIVWKENQSGGFKAKNQLYSSNRVDKSIYPPKHTFYFVLDILPNCFLHVR